MQKIESATDAGPADPKPNRNPLPAETVSLEEERARRAARRSGRMNRYLGGAAAAIALIVGVTGALNVIRDDDKGSDVRAADRPTGTAPGPSPATTAPVTRAPFGEFSAKFAKGIAAAPFLKDPIIVESEVGTHPTVDAVEGVDTYALTHNETSTGVAAPLEVGG